MFTKGQAVADLVVNVRDQAEMSNAALAEASGLSSETIDRVTSGQTLCPTDRTMAHLALALPISLGQLRQAAIEDGCTGVGSFSEPTEDDDMPLMMADHATLAHKDLAHARSIIEGWRNADTQS